MVIYMHMYITLLHLFSNSTDMFDTNSSWHISTDSGHDIKWTLILVGNNCYYLYMLSLECH